MADTWLDALIFYILMFIVVYVAMCFVWRKNAVRDIKTPIVIRAREKEKIGTMDKVLIVEAIAIVLYIIADMAVVWHTGTEPSTLTVSFFAVCGGENGFMAWIKTRKEQERMRRWQYEDTGKPEDYKEDKTL